MTRRRAWAHVAAALALAALALSTSAQPTPGTRNEATPGARDKASELVAGKPWIGSAEEYTKLAPVIAKRIDESSDEVVASLRRDAGWNPSHPKWAATRERVRSDMRAAWAEAGQALLGGIEPARYNQHLVDLYLANLEVPGLDELLVFYRSPAGERYRSHLRELSITARESEPAVMDLLAGGPPRWESQDPERMKVRIQTLLLLEPMQAMANIAREPDEPKLAADMSATLLTIAAVRGEKIDAVAAGLDVETRALIEAFQKTPARAKERAMLVAESERIYRASREWSSALPAFLKQLEAQEAAWKKLAAD